MGRRIIEAAVMFGSILFIGYMCGAPIIFPDSDNFFAYSMAFAFGLGVYSRPS